MPHSPSPEEAVGWNQIANPAHLNAIIESTADAVISVDEAQRIVLFNKGAEQAFGYRASEILGQPLALLMPGHNPVHYQYQQRHDDFAAQSQAARFIPDAQSIIMGHRKNGDQFPVEMSIVKTSVNGETVFTTILRDATTRSRLLESLHVNENRLNLIIESVQDALWDWNIATGEIYRNPQWARLLGYNPTGIDDTLMAWENLIHPSDRPVVQRALQDHLEGHTPIYQIEYRLRTASGEWKWVLTRGRIVERDDQGHPLRMAGIHTDITERKQAERALQAQRDFALQIMNTMGQGLTVVGSDTRFEYVNPAYARMLGCAPEDIIGKSPADFTFSEDHSVLATIRSQRVDGQITTYETPLRHSNGSVVHALISGTPRWRNGKIDGAIAVITDLTERKQAEAALSESEAKNRALLSAIPDLMFINRRDGTYLSYHSPALSDLVTEHPSRFLGKRIADILPPDVAQPAMHHIEQALETGEVQLYKYQLTINGVTRHFEARMVASGDDEVLMILRDISEQFRLEQMKSDFINRAAHELRTPLTTILMMVDLIEEGGAEAEIKQYWQVLHSELEHQRELVEELLTMGRLESDKLQLNIAPLDLAPILLEALSTGAPLAQAKSIRIDVEMAPELPLVKGDKISLRQAFVNLLNNAVKFTPENGEITLRAKRHDDGLAVQVCDTGIGIPAEDLPLLFGRFFRASNATQNEIPGSGIGLYIVKAIVEKLGGRIRVESQVGTGTMFEVWLPAFKSAEPQTQGLQAERN